VGLVVVGGWFRISYLVSRIAYRAGDPQGIKLGLIRLRQRLRRDKLGLFFRGGLGRFFLVKPCGIEGCVCFGVEGIGFVLHNNVMILW